MQPTNAPLYLPYRNQYQRMKVTLRILISFVFLLGFHASVIACSPLNVPTLVSQSLSGSTLVLNWSSNTTYNCTYYVEVEFACTSGSFTGTGVPAFYPSATISKTTTPFAYPTQNIGISTLCPGSTYKFRAREAASSSTFSSWTSTYTFTTPGTFTTPTINVTGTPGSICIPATSQLNATVTNGCGSTPQIFSWTPTTGLSSSSIANPVASPTVTTTYTSVVTGGALGCWSVTGSVTITIAAPPVAGTASVTPSTLCAGTPVTLTLAGSAGTIQWQSAPVSGGPWTDISGATTTPFVTAALSSNTCFRAVVTGCLSSNSNVVCVTVSPMPTATIAGTTSVCLGATAPDITITGAGGTTPYTFTYTINGGSNLTITTSSGSSVTFTIPTNTAGTTTYTLVSVQDASSTACSQVQSGSAIVTVNPLPTATIAGTTTVCKNATAPGITFTGANGTAPYTFTYTINGGANLTVTTTSGNSVIVSAPSSAVGVFIYALVSVQDASSSTCSQTQSGSTTITVNPLPTATIAGTIAICKGDAAPDITFSGAASTPPYTFTYTINSGANLTVTTTSGNSVMVSVPTGTAGTFIYDLVSVEDASSTACSQTQSGTATVTINPLPTATITGTIAVCKDAAAPDITFTGAAGTAPYTFTYTINGGANLTITTTSGNSITVAAPTTTTGTFTYALVSIQDASSTTCSQTQSGSATVTVNPLPTATIAGTIAVCRDAAAPDITFTGAAGTAPYTFTYTINGGASQTVTTTSGNSVNVSAPTASVGVFISALVSVQDASTTTCSQTQGGTATVTVNPLPTATITGTVSVCKDAAAPDISFTGAAGTAPYTFTYTINGGANQTVTTTSGSSVTVSVPTGTAGTFIYDLVSVQDASTTTCSQTQSGTATVTVNPLPTATISGTVSVCKGGTAPDITFTGAAGTSPYTFTYTINGVTQPTIASTGNSITVSAPTSVDGTFTYSLVSVMDASSTACSQLQTGTAVVTVTLLPTATIVGTIAVCKNSISPDITFTGAVATAPYTFTYTINGGANQTVTTISGNSVTVAAPTGTVGTFIYDLISVHDASLTACSQLQSGSVTVTVDPLPIADYSFTDVCLTQTMTFNDLSTVSSGTNVDWSWNFDNNSPLGSTQTPVSLYTTAGTYNVSLITTTDKGCKDTITHSVVVHPNPNTQFSVINACDGNSVQFNDLSTITTGNALQTWTWNFGDGSPVNTNQTISGGYLYTSVGSYVAKLLVVSSFGCKDSITHTVTVNPNPIVSFAAIDTIGCELFCASFVDHSSIVTGNNIHWTWTVGDGSAAINSQTFDHCYSNDLEFAPKLFNVTLTVTSDSGCVSTLSKNNYITVYPNPIANFSTLPENTPITNPVISLIDASTGTNFWNWNFGDGSNSFSMGIDTTISSSPLAHSYADTGTYTIMLVTSTLYGCVDTAYHSIIIEPDFLFFIPNTFTPNDDGINDFFTGKGINIKIFEMMIFDRWGNLIFFTDDLNKPWDGKANFGTKLAQEDVYVYSVKLTDYNRRKHSYKGIVTLLR